MHILLQLFFSFLNIVLVHFYTFLIVRLFGSLKAIPDILGTPSEVKAINVWNSTIGDLDVTGIFKVSWTASRRAVNVHEIVLIERNGLHFRKGLIQCELLLLLLGRDPPSFIPPFSSYVAKFSLVMLYPLHDLVLILYRGSEIRRENASL